MDGKTLEWLAAVTEAAGGSSAALMAAAARAREAPGSCTVVLVEGMSDQAAVQTLAARRGRDLPGENIFVVPMGGATNIAHFLAMFGPNGFGVRLAGLCDEAEEHDFRRGLERAGLGTGPFDLATLGFFVCVADLEDELIRALGASTVERLVAEQGELTPFQTFAQAARPPGRAARAAAAPLPGHPLRPQDPLRPPARRRPRPHPGARTAGRPARLGVTSCRVLQGFLPAHPAVRRGHNGRGER